MKSKLLLIASAACFMCAGYMAKAQAAGPATNQVTLAWSFIEAPQVPFNTEIQQSLLNTNTWTILANVPGGQTNYTFNISKQLTFFRVRSINATNGAWNGDFSNVASTLWPPAGGNLSIRLGP